LADIGQIIEPTDPGAPVVGGNRDRQGGRHGLGPSSLNDLHKLMNAPSRGDHRCRSAR
jgi:hypothetical protein